VHDGCLAPIDLSSQIPNLTPKKSFLLMFVILDNLFWSKFNKFENNLVNAEFVKEYDKSGGVN
jgi:hypothetical protein